MADFTNINNVYVKDSDLWDGIDYIKDKIGYDDIIGVEVDYENNTFRRLASAVGKTAGADFNLYPMYSGMKRCNLADDGTVNAYYGDAGYVEDGSNGQVMVEIPKFYYRVIPLKLQKNTDYTGAMGNHLLKARYYISSTPKNGFKVHPLFHIGNRVINKAYISAYEGCIYDVSAGAYLQEDEQVADFTAGTGDKLSSIAGVRTASASPQDFTRPNIRTLCHNRGTGWEIQTAQSVCALYLLFIIEYGNCDLQHSIGDGVVHIQNAEPNTNCASYTGSTASLGNASGRATSTKDWKGVEQTDADKTAVSYRGVENLWGNTWSVTDGMNIFGDGTMGGGQPYVCFDGQFNDTVSGYTPSGFTSAHANGYVKYFGYGNKKTDWLFSPTKTQPSSYTSCPDFFICASNLNSYRMPVFGGYCTYQQQAGMLWAYTSPVTYKTATYNARLIYIG